MIVSEMKCGMCGHRFEAELLGREDPREGHVPLPELQQHDGGSGPRGPAGDAASVVAR